jgi:anti-sigma regulatory factor (Ser/Thr protein kinase)
MSDLMEAELPRSPSAPGLARRLLSEAFVGALDGVELDRAKLLVSELVTNAVLHGRGKITLKGSLDQDKLLVEVIDEGSGFERVVRELEFGEIGRWGLGIVDAEASRWGVHEGTTHVWFEIERSGPRVGTESNPFAEGR